MRRYSIRFVSESYQTIGSYFKVFGKNNHVRESTDPAPVQSHMLRALRDIVEKAVLDRDAVVVVVDSIGLFEEAESASQYRKFLYSLRRAVGGADGGGGVVCGGGAVGECESSGDGREDGDY